jgi:hypothetical protein
MGAVVSVNGRPVDCVAAPRGGPEGRSMASVRDISRRCCVLIELSRPRMTFQGSLFQKRKSGN